MPIVRFTAARSLVAGVTLGATITYTLPVRYAGQTRSRKVYKTTRRTLSGRRETYTDSVENGYSIQTKPLTTVQAESLVMFLDSVERGEQFDFAPTDGAFSAAVLEGDGYEEPRNPARDSMTAYAFQIAVLPT